jgi:hypothetical protein
MPSSPRPEEKDEAGPDTRPTTFRFPAIHGIVHVSRDYVIEAGGKRVRFEESGYGYGGPIVVGKRGQDLKNQPGERHPFWTAYGAWCKGGKRVRDGNVCVYEIPKPPRKVKLWRGNYTQADHDDPRTDEEIRAAFLGRIERPGGAGGETDGK